MSRISVLWQLVRPYRARLLTAIVLTMMHTVCALTPPLVMRYLIDNVITTRQWKMLAVVITLVAFIPVWNALLAMWNRLVIAAFGQRLVVDLRSALFRTIMQLSMRYHGKVGAGPLISRLMGDVGIVQRMITGETLGILSNTVALTFCAAMAVYLNWHLSLIMALMVILFIVNYHLFAMKIRRANLDLRETIDEVTGSLQERIAGVRLVKIYCRERDETNAFLASTEKALQIGMRTQRLSISLNSTAHLISQLGATIIWFGAGWYVLNGDMTYGSMAALSTYVSGAVTPALQLTMVAGTLIEAMASLDRTLEVLHEQPDIREAPDARELPETIDGDVRFEGVTFAYAPDKPLFDRFDLHMLAGRMTALVGHTGCGKTSVTSLLMRLWDVQDGAITIDGIDIRTVTLRSLRRHVGVVPQEPVVFEGTIYENIAYAQPDATYEQVEEAARAAQIHDAIIALPDSYQSFLGKEGVKLSVGEKQRIAIARAILPKPAILILDEATSSLDTASELAIQEAMRTVLRGRTSIVVAHRLSTIVEADQIIVMDEGRVLEIGDHHTLLAREGGAYRALYEEMVRRQSEEGVA